ncbi:hypothetical protein [Chitinophaga sp. Cy-1792]|uniref:hypothetical protein n=1 Tax=Chitinophaga sp. Cy-1792 TaxID=2608339 RepID=UPI001421E4C8|nr:hypothetical protein [Chitinophaga sp. Cy-1792]NIG57470.1 hypothetical protein [Chitinophaga sp. Cy-1792]
MSQLKKGDSYAQIEGIIQSAVSGMADGQKQATMEELQHALDELNPLDCNSMEWNACRYALMYIRTQMAEAV